MRPLTFTTALARAVPAFSLAASLFGCAPSGAPPAREAGTVRFDIAADPSTLNPLFARQDANAVDQQLAHLTFLPFIDLDERGKAVPVLLREIPTVANGGLSQDGRTIRYHLREGVQWEDGQPVTARDVLFTLRAISDDRNPVRSRAGYELIDRVAASDERTVVVHLRRRWAPAIATFFTYGTAPQFVLPEHAFKPGESLAQAAFNAAPLGNGPFKFVNWRRGERLVYEANPRYFRGVPGAKRLDVRIVPDPQTNLTLLQSGILDWNLIAPAQQRALAGKHEIDYRYAPLALVAGVALNLRHPPLDDVRMRRAIAASIDRRGISAKITLGRYPTVDTDQPLWSWAFDASARLPAYDPVAADAALDDAGWLRGKDGMRSKSGKPLAFTYVQFPESTTGVRAATVIQEQLHSRGIAVTIKSVSNAQLFLPKSRGGLLATGGFDMAYVPWPMGADPDDSFLLACNGAANYMHYCNPEVDALETRALALATQTERKALYARIQRIVAQDVPIVYLFNPTYVYAMRRSLSGFAPNAFAPTWNAAGWRLAP